MKRIGILSDTHACWDNRYEEYFSDCDEIWHAGDFGSIEIADRLNEITALRGVYGNCDGWDIRAQYPEVQCFTIEDVKVLLTHIGGYPGRYYPNIYRKLAEEKPDIFVCGHSHILKIMPDRAFRLIHINPGAAGIQGIHAVRTLIRLTLNGGEAKDIDVIEFPKQV